MQPIFPTLTFPNHWTLLTGLYASSHGIVANDFTDSSGNQFYYTSPAHSWSSEWWRGEPIWATAQRNGLNSAVLMWPGPPETQAGTKARYFQKYESDWKLDDRLGKVLEWMDEDDVRVRPSCVCVYVPDIDQASHRFGPESEQAVDAVKRVDGFIGKLRKEVVEKRSLGEIVDIVVVSDHGMTSTSNDKLIYLDELLGNDLYAQLQGRDGWPSAGLRFRGTPSHREQLEHLAFQRLSSLPSKSRRGWKVFKRSTLPPRYHLNDDGRVDDRLAPIWIIPDLGWSITDHAEMATFADGTYAPRGNHGYDNQQDDMQAIFVASGPSFRDWQEVKGRRWNMDGFANVQVHNLVSRILGVRETARAQTNGTWEFWDQHLRDGL
ncbi:hypothetical protein PHSY_001626 [Pseudozyma hubeiensis SY62]|uniref:Type I phosphodiesterase/nucleotide pyrophosphatase n=1 Tax=Pseudozyma hubeiensis (strain SY62) TaxID=1305764 RepID=R9NZC7_PSEHS|nr:hypothetical protein PHSY_001626 [Pseudozyma hubeiensis SY62]GAC94057.1 hypothetical protein PHSY_001626 [Pseudozyma hubeiensis SY62]